MLKVISSFQLDSNAVSCERYGSGHINETYLVVTQSGRRYILQKVNHHVFRDVPALMANIEAVTRHVATKEKDPRHVLRLVPTFSGESYVQDEQGEYYRVYDFVEGSLSLDRAEQPEDFHQSGVAFGQFQSQLADFPATTLSETIPHFHDTEDRVRKLRAAIQSDTAGRVREVQAECDFALARAEEAATMVRMQRAGELPTRVTHNDTKLNNVMLDAVTRTPLCVIDLDTVMPGLSANDFGDSIRFGASTGAEDEKNLDLISMSLPLYQQFATGFLKACGDCFTKLELETLPLGAKLMTYECGIRFLTDYLEGDVYFRIHRPEHNLDRTRTQFKLVADMEQKRGEMEKIIRKIMSR